MATVQTLGRVQRMSHRMAFGELGGSPHFVANSAATVARQMFGVGEIHYLIKIDGGAWWNSRPLFHSLFSHS